MYLEIGNFYDFVKCLTLLWPGLCYARKTGGNVPLRPPLIKDFLDVLDKLKFVIKFKNSAQKLTILKRRKKCEK